MNIYKILLFLLLSNLSLIVISSSSDQINNLKKIVLDQKTKIRTNSRSISSAFYYNLTKAIDALPNEDARGGKAQAATTSVQPVAPVTQPTQPTKEQQDRVLIRLAHKTLDSYDKTVGVISKNKNNIKKASIATALIVGSYQCYKHRRYLKLQFNTIKNKLLRTIAAAKKNKDKKVAPKR